MRRSFAGSLLLLLIAGCSGGPVSMQPAPLPVLTTGLVLTVTYRQDLVDALHINGTTMVTARAFGPYDLTPAQLASGQTVGLVFDASDAGGVMVCGTADGPAVTGGGPRDGHDWGGGGGTGAPTHLAGCGMYTLIGGQVVDGELALDRQ